MRRSIVPLASAAIAGLCLGHVAACAGAGDDRVRIATFNIEDVNPTTIAEEENRLTRLGRVICDIDADIILLNEIAYGTIVGAGGGPQAPLFADGFVKGFVAGSCAVDSPGYVVFAAPSNTGVHSGFDLDNNGSVSRAPGSRAYGGDCLGYGAFEGQYGMALLVRSDLEILSDEIRTFKGFLWKDMPDALLPPIIEEEGGAVMEGAWYSEEEQAVLPLSSKSHWDVPVRLRDGRVLHVLCSHPTPPVFDGAEDRNGRRNHDEIRFWAEYIDGAEWIYDDEGGRGGLEADALFVILGDQNADPDEGDSFANPMKRWLLDHARVNAAETPRSGIPMDRLDPDDTSGFRLRVDYVLPSVGLEVVGSGVVRGAEDLPPARGDGESGPERGAARAEWEAWDEFPSDHFPVWVDIAPGEGE